MHGPATVGWLLVALCALTGASCLLRARGARAAQRRAAGSEALMGFGMAVTAVPASAVRSTPPAAFVVLFAAVAAWELVLAYEHRDTRRESAHHLHHALGALAMVYMALAMTPVLSGAHGGSGTGLHAHHASAVAAAGVPLLTGALLAYFAVYVLRTGARLVPAMSAAPVSVPRAGTPEGGGGTRGCAVRDEPGFALACRLAMGTGMLAMLATL